MLICLDPIKLIVYNSARGLKGEGTRDAQSRCCLIFKDTLFFIVSYVPSKDSKKRCTVIELSKLFNKFSNITDLMTCSRNSGKGSNLHE